MPSIIEILLRIGIGLFIVGFAYGLLRGNEKTHWLLRSVASGFIFMFFYIVIPLAELDMKLGCPSDKFFNKIPKRKMK